MAYPNYPPHLYTGTNSDDAQHPAIADPAMVEQQAKEEIALYPRGLELRTDMAMMFSDTSSGSRLYQHSSRPPSMTTSATRDYLHELDDPNASASATSPLHPQAALPSQAAPTLSIPDYTQIQGVGGWSEQSPGTIPNNQDMDFPILGRMEGLENPNADHDAQMVSPKAENPKDAAWLFVKENMDDFLNKRRSDKIGRSRLSGALDVLKDIIDENDSCRCYDPNCSSIKLGNKGTVVRHIQNFHLAPHIYDCSLIGGSMNRVTKHNNKEKFHRRDKFVAEFHRRFGRNPSKQEVDRCRRSVPCPSTCHICHQGVTCWTSLYNHLFEDHCPKTGLAPSATTSRRSSLADLKLNTENEQPSPTSDISSNYQDDNGHLIPPSAGQNQGTSHRGSGSLSTGAFSPGRPSSICSDGGIPPSQPHVDRRQASVPDIHRLRNSQQFPSFHGFPFPSQPPEPPQDPGYTHSTLCGLCQHPMSRCRTCQELSRSVAGPWCHVCLAGGRSSNTLDQTIPLLQFSAPTPGPENAGLPLYQGPPSYNMNVPYNQPHSQRRGNQRRQQYTRYNPYQGSNFGGFSATIGGDTQVITAGGIPAPMEHMFPECKPCLYQVKSSGPICATPKNALSRSMKILRKSLVDLGNCLGELKSLVIRDPTIVCQRVPPQALDSPIVVSEPGTPRIAKARVSIGKGEKIDMRARLLPNEKPGHLLRSRVQIVVKLIKLRSSAAEAAGRRERQQSETSEQDVATTAEPSDAVQQPASGDDDNEDGESDNDHDEDNEDSQSEEDEKDDESRAESDEQPETNDMESLTASFARRLSLLSPSFLDVDWANDQDSTEPNKDHEEASLGVYVATDLPSCLQNMPNWSTMLSELTGFGSERAASRFFELLLQHLFMAILACDPSPEAGSKKKLGEK